MGISPEWSLCGNGIMTIETTDLNRDVSHQNDSFAWAGENPFLTRIQNSNDRSNLDFSDLNSTLSDQLRLLVGQDSVNQILWNLQPIMENVLNNSATAWSEESVTAWDNVFRLLNAGDVRDMDLRLGFVNDYINNYASRVTGGRNTNGINIAVQGREHMYLALRNESVNLLRDFGRVSPDSLPPWILHVHSLIGTL